MSAKALLKRTAGVLRGLTAPADPAYAATVEMQFDQHMNLIDSLQEIHGEVITADDPWAFEVKPGTCFGGMFTVIERMSKTKHLYRCREVLFQGATDSESIYHEVIVKCTFLTKDMTDEDRIRAIEYVGRDIDAIGVQANCSPFSLELIAGGKLTTPDGIIVVLWEAFEVMAGDAKQLAMSLGGKFPPFLAIRFLLEVLEVLTIYHNSGDHGIIHRDVKPQNVLFDQPSISWLSLRCTHFKLGDAQLAKGTSGEIDVTQTGTPVGTPQYMAPEQALGREATVAVDVWALGATLFELITGELPHTPTEAMRAQGSGITTHTALTYLMMIAQQEPKRLSAYPGIHAQYPAWFIDMIDSMLSMNPLDRPTSFACLDLAQREMGIHVPPVPLPTALQQTIPIASPQADRP